MDLNSINCGGYRVEKSAVVFSLTDTTVEEVSALDKQKLTLTIVPGNQRIFDGYEIANIDVTNTNISVRFTKQLTDATKKSIEALEENFDNLSTLVATNQNYTAIAIDSMDSAIAPIIMRADLSDKEAINLEMFYPEWAIGVDYKQGWIVKYDGALYRIGQDHTSQEQWIPGSDGTDSLYSKIEITESGYEVWKEWDGVSGSYSSGQIVEDPNDNQLYISKIDSNVWGPPSQQPTYWDLYTEE